VLFISASLTPPSENSVVPPGFSVQPVAEEVCAGIHQVTLDTSDQEVWIPFSLELGRVVPEGPAADLYVRRQLFQAPYGALDLGEGALEDAVLPIERTWVEDESIDEVPQNPVLCRWYSYSYFSHLLTSRGETQAVRLASGKSAILDVVSYYCENETSGCLTFRYKLVDG
ncbi:MAG: HmuY family protein, partial [Myxococcota bacterium]|nr:HmuY family protein [Myxococcota bacterium]